MNHTMAKQNPKSVSIAGLSDKLSIVGVFTITLNGHFLPMQFIYGGKTKQSLPRFTFADGFLLSCNPKHFSNAMEYIKLINEIIIAYVQGQRKELGKPKEATLVIMDVFQGQITDDVMSLLRDNNIHTFWYWIMWLNSFNLYIWRLTSIVNHTWNDYSQNGMPSRSRISFPLGKKLKKLR